MMAMTGIIPILPGDATICPLDFGDSRLVALRVEKEDGHRTLISLVSSESILVFTRDPLWVAAKRATAVLYPIGI